MAVKARATVTVTRYRDTEAVTRYYKLQSSTLAKPAKPTAKPPSGWTATEPAYAEGATSSLYTCELTLFSDGSWAYSDVSLSSSYEAAKEAYNEAEAAKQAAADALNKTHYGACNTAQATAAKATASDIAGFVLTAGASVRIKFTYANTSAAPTLNVNGTGAKQIRLNGANSAYWVAGATVDFVFDGSYWQVCSTPLYGATATIGNPVGANVYADGESLAMRQGQTVLARFKSTLVELGLNAASAVVKMCGGKGAVGYSQTSPLGEARPGLDIYTAGDDGINVFSQGSGTARVVSGSSDLKKSGAVVVGNQYVNLGVGNGSSAEFGSGGQVSLSNGEARINAKAIYLNNVPWDSVSQANYGSSIKAWPNPINTNATNAWASGKFANAEVHGGALSLASGGIRVLAAGTYIIFYKIMFSNNSAGDIMHYGVGTSASNILSYQQVRCAGTYDTLTMCEIVALGAGTVLYPYFKCEQGYPNTASNGCVSLVYVRG